MKTCPKCNAQNANTADTCKSCGANLNENTPILSSAILPDENQRGNVIVALILALLAVVVTFVKGGFTIEIDEEGYALGNFYIHFITTGIALVLTALSIFFVRGAFDKKPVPMKSVFAIMMVIAAIVVMIFDLIALPGTISDYRAASAIGALVVGLLRK